MRLGRVIGNLTLILTLTLLVSGCGGGDDKSPSQEKCEQFANRWCSKKVGCLVSLGTLQESERANNLSVCVDAAVEKMECEKAASVGASYNQCLSDIEGMECASWDVPIDQVSTVTGPTSCSGAILFQP